MEKKLGEIDKRKEDADKSQTTAATLTEMDKSETPLLTKRQSVFRRQNTTQPK